MHSDLTITFSYIIKFVIMNLTYAIVLKISNMVFSSGVHLLSSGVQDYYNQIV
jgi:hypothetical protein